MNHGRSVAIRCGIKAEDDFRSARFKPKNVDRSKRGILVLTLSDVEYICFREESPGTWFVIKRNPIVGIAKIKFKKINDIKLTEFLRKKGWTNKYKDEIKSKEKS